MMDRPDIVLVDSRFNGYIVRNTPIRRLHVGTLWAEGPAWNGVGRYDNCPASTGNIWAGAMACR